MQNGQFAILTKNGPRKDVACTYGFPGDPREANALLIAAAPEMLALLQRFKSFPFEGYEFVYPLGSLQELQHIIAKATGEQS
jgi:hypothetical protein